MVCEYLPLKALISFGVVLSLSIPCSTNSMSDPRARPSNDSATNTLWTSRPDLLEGDIIQEGGTSRASVNKKIYLWPRGIVPYVMDSGLTALARLAISKAMRKMESLSCISFKLRTNERYFVRFIRGAGCYSCIGRTMDTNGQVVSIGFGCEQEGIVLHELMHTVGFFHTNSRPDRDAYVIVYSKNIRPGFERNFRKYSHGQADRLGAPYDVTSVMHVPRRSWSRNGKNTIESRAGAHVVLGQQRGLSVVDKQQLNQLYNCGSNKGCFVAVGIEKGQIRDSQLRASSYKRYHEPHQARLHLTAGFKGNGAWCAARSRSGEYLQIDLGSRHKITAVATQGMTSLFSKAWVKGYRVQRSDDGRRWVSSAQILRGNWDANSVQYNALRTPLSGRYVRIVPDEWYNQICLRVELYGCK
ncbi:zinc metalloproteinase nas-15-like [Stylophora pistillata]|uniref:Metalloendopeptidase n=1 Tax=Stylophora pistillata TaxID=50429 RepID=A0A2B4SX92_STYPI|nr:zinc metalloproteinase nas-15-like [Stylophora pistillata]PFX33047.1 Zinc metalloproteinase nas-14 [Stylophora pistillata]